MTTEPVHPESFGRLIKENPACLFYFSHDDCQVCHVLRPRTEKMLREEFPSILYRYINVRENPATAAQQSVLTVPTLLLFLDGKENLRMSRYIHLDELRKHLQRWYALRFPTG